jgi:glycerophosphoryl diester phosphodiesterase
MSASKPAPAPWPYPLWIAHRGAGSLAPENTLAAFRIGAAHGFRAFECDVKLSADGVPFLLHDATLKRTTSGRGRAGRHAWHALSQLDAGSWHGAAFAGEPLPTLRAVAAYVRANGFAVNLEIKPTPGTEAATGAAVAREARRLWRGGGVPPLLSSFQPVALRQARLEAPDLPRGLLLSSLREGWLAEAQALGCVAVATEHRLMSAAVAGALRAAGMHAWCYTVNDAAEAARLIALGVDGLFTDAVASLGPGAGPCDAQDR